MRSTVEWRKSSFRGFFDPMSVSTAPPAPLGAPGAQWTKNSSSHPK